MSDGSPSPTLNTQTGTPPSFSSKERAKESSSEGHNPRSDPISKNTLSSIGAEQSDHTSRVLAALAAKRKAEEELRMLSAKRPHTDTFPTAERRITNQWGSLSQNHLNEAALSSRDKGNALQHMISGVDSDLLAQRRFAGSNLLLGTEGIGLSPSYQGHLPQLGGLLGSGTPGLSLSQPYLSQQIPLPLQQSVDSLGLPGYSSLSPYSLLQQHGLRDAALAQAHMQSGLREASLAHTQSGLRDAALVRAQYSQQLSSINAASLPGTGPTGHQGLNSLLMGGGNIRSQKTTASPIASAALSSAHDPTPIPALDQPLLSLPPCDESAILTFANRGKYPLGIDEDPNWLSEFHCFVRMDMVEVFRASRDDCKSRNNSIAYQQVGIRCRFCAHLPSTTRAGRASAFPSSLRQIYQSFTMMLRDHFGNCDAIPSSVQRKFLTLKEMPSQGATDSKRFWIYSAMKIGMADSSEGIVINERTVAAGRKASSFGMDPDQPWADDALRNVPIVFPRDRGLVHEFLVVLMSQVQLVRLTEAEKIGNRRSLDTGLPGFGCRFCCENRRLGLCRMFPARRRTLPSKVNDLYDHIRRCTLVPQHVKANLETLKLQMASETIDRDEEKEFFDRVWTRIGHASNSS